MNQVFTIGLKNWEYNALDMLKHLRVMIDIFFLLLLHTAKLLRTTRNHYIHFLSKTITRGKYSTSTTIQTGKCLLSISFDGFKKQHSDVFVKKPMG